MRFGINSLLIAYTLAVVIAVGLEVAAIPTTTYYVVPMLPVLFYFWYYRKKAIKVESSGFINYTKRRLFGVWFPLAVLSTALFVHASIERAKLHGYILLGVELVSVLGCFTYIQHKYNRTLSAGLLVINRTLSAGLDASGLTSKRTLIQTAKKRNRVIIGVLCVVLIANLVTVTYVRNDLPG